MEWAIFELLLSCFHLSALHVSLHPWYGPLMQLAGCLCLCSLLSVSYCVTSFLCAKDRQCFKIGTEHTCGTSVRQILAARWIGRRRHRHNRMRRRKKTSCGRKRFWSAKTSLGLLIVSWKIGLFGIRVGEAAVPGPATTTYVQPNGKNHNLWETRGGGKASLSEAHSVLIRMLRHIQQLSRKQAYCHANETQKMSLHEWRWQR